MRALCSFVTGLPVVLLGRQCLRATLTIAVWLSLAADDHAAGELVRAPHGMVVSSHRRASEAGVEVLRNGGNAVDAAIATGLALAVVHPSAGNLGGGGFMLVFMKSGEIVAFDFREKAPWAARPDMFLGANGKYLKDSNHEGYRSVGVPGTVAGFDLALNRFGTRPWKDLAAPAVRLAEDGFPLSEAMAKEFSKRRKDWRRCPAAAQVFLKPDRSAYRAGDIWRQPDLARTLRRLQERGRAGFYQGETAQLLAADMKQHGGLITEADLAAYEAKERAPVHGTYRGFDVYSMPPPSSGGVALVEMLNILEGYDLKALGHNSAPYLHLLAEAMRRAFADRARYLGDADFNPDLPLATLTSKEHGARLRQTIKPGRASKSDPARFGDAYESVETTHYSVVDAAGNAVAVTYTLEYSFGARLVAEGLGFLYNNEMGDFNPEPGRTDRRGLIGTPGNLVAPGKRMLSSMTPTILAKEGKPWLVIGSPGGRTIINTVLQVVLNTVDFDLDLAQAIGAGRAHHQWLPDELLLEPETASPTTKRQLKAMGHAVRTGGKLGQGMGILVEPATGQRLGAADPRAPDGAAVGDGQAVAPRGAGSDTSNVLGTPAARCESELVFPLHPQHNHAPGIVECPNGDLLVSWYRGSGERTADDVAVFGARRRSGSKAWSESFLLADRPGFPDCNTCLMVDRRGRLWLFWPTILANSWESCLTNFKWSTHFSEDGPPRWEGEGLVLLKPDDFRDEGIRVLDDMLAKRAQPLSPKAQAEIAEARQRLGNKLYQRLGWQPRCKPTVLPSGRILLPLYSDTFSISIMAISDDGGDNWFASKPLIGFGNIQPAVLRRDDGTLVAYMRENGPLQHVRVAESKDDGSTWGAVGVSELPNPGSGLDGVRLANGHWLLVYNDTTSGRNRLAVSISSDEGHSWKWSRHLEAQETGSYHYPAVIQGKDDTIHVVYSYFVAGGKSMKHAALNEAWVQQGDR